jgi:hypothetical protein
MLSAEISGPGQRGGLDKSSQQDTERFHLGQALVVRQSDDVWNAECCKQARHVFLLKALIGDGGQIKE